jgi:hypothetical protein
MTAGVAVVLTVCADVASATSQEGASSMSGALIRNLLKKDFGLDLNIAGGTGQSADDPIVVKSSSESEASKTEFLVLRGLGKGRGIHWRSLGTAIVSSSPGSIIQRKIETKDARPEQVISQVENYYFRRSEAPPSSSPPYADFIAHNDQTISVEFPYELSWLHFGELVDYESRQPGMGYSLAYNAPGIKATVYVYPIADDSLSYMSELTRARSDIERMYGENAIQHEWKIQDRKDHVLYYFIPSNEPSSISFILISIRQGHFIKVRCTFVDDPLLREVSNDFSESLVTLIRFHKNSLTTLVAQSWPTEMDKNEIASQSSNDLAVALSSEFEAWFRDNCAKGALRRSFTGVTKDGVQAVVILTGSPFDHVERRDFIIWLCRKEKFIAYAYGTPVGRLSDDTSTVTEGLDIFASSDRYSVEVDFDIDKLADDTFQLSELHRSVMPVGRESGMGEIFCGLQRSTNEISSDKEELFQRVWKDLKPKSMWRQR